MYDALVCKDSGLMFSYLKIYSFLENRLVVAEGEGEEVGWTGSLGLVDANY